MRSIWSPKDSSIYYSSNEVGEITLLKNRAKWTISKDATLVFTIYYQNEKQRVVIVLNYNND